MAGGSLRGGELDALADRDRHPRRQLLGYLDGDIDSIKGLCQRGGQVLFGAWLVLLGVWAAAPDREPGSPG